MVRIRNGNAAVKVMLLLVGKTSSSVVGDLVSKSSKHVNSQHNKPIWNDLQSCGGVHKTARQFCLKII